MSAADLQFLVTDLRQVVFDLPAVVVQDGQVLHASELRGALHRVGSLAAQASRTLDDVKARG